MKNCFKSDTIHPLMDIIGFAKKDALLVISAVLALVSLFLVPFETVLSYNYMSILETICTLLFFLLIVAGLKECNALNVIAQKAVTNIETTTKLCLVLVLLPFFCAMFFSNDVALMTFVPLAIAILSMAGMKGTTTITVVVLQTVAANVGSFLTPFGNPHNLYIYNLNSQYGFTLWDYEMQLIPIVAVGTAVLLALVMLVKRKPLKVQFDKEEKIENRRSIPVLLALFVLAILTVLDVIPFYITLVVIVAVFLVMMPRVFWNVSYNILFIFFFLFLFANGLTSMEAVHSVIDELMAWDPMLSTVIFSQFTSNVPATILLQPFTDSWWAVLVGADIGGFGTPIASMASVISLNLYLKEKDASAKAYLKVFLLINTIMLATLIPTYMLLH